MIDVGQLAYLQQLVERFDAVIQIQKVDGHWHIQVLDEEVTTLVTGRSFAEALSNLEKKRPPVCVAI